MVSKKGEAAGLNTWVPGGTERILVEPQHGLERMGLGSK